MEYNMFNFFSYQHFILTEYLLHAKCSSTLFPPCDQHVCVYWCLVLSAWRLGVSITLRPKLNFLISFIEVVVRLYTGRKIWIGGCCKLAAGGVEGPDTTTWQVVFSHFCVAVPAHGSGGAHGHALPWWAWRVEGRVFLSHVEIISCS